MNLLQQITTVLRLWTNYGPTLQQGLALFEDLQALDDGKLFDEVEKVFSKHGINIGAIVASAAGKIDLTTIAGIQTALNRAMPNLVPIGVDGIYGIETYTRVAKFQIKFQISGCTPGLADTNTVNALLASLT